jgi:hypothetical protein
MANVRVWEDDPLAGAVAVERAQAKLPKSPLGITIDVPAPPAKLYEPGTAEFRYWQAADAVARGVAFWKPLMPKGTSWQVGKTLPVHLDAGDKLNAVYTRGDLRFFHANVGGTMVFTGESPDVVCHELGHGILDAIRPQLWDAMSGEVAAFHESFGDMSSILVALQQPSIREQAVTETGGALYRSSRLSRVMEQLGWGQRQRQPCSVEGDCLRNAVNCFSYQPPTTLPNSAPAVLLSSASHSFSRVFTAAFFQMYAGMVVLLHRPPTADDLLQASVDAGRLLVTAIQAAPVVPDYFAQVAAHIVEADTALFEGRYASAIEYAMGSRGILSLPSFRAVTATPALASFGSLEGAELPNAAFTGSEFGLDRPVVMRVPGQPRRLAALAVANDGGSLATTPAEEVAAGYLRELMLRQRVALPAEGDVDPGEPGPLKTHRLVDRGDHLVVERVLVD